jgi:hypothetical protein
VGPQGRRAHPANLSLLLERDFGSVEQLNRYRKNLGARSEAPSLALA